jgi:hypothetical protein
MGSTSAMKRKLNFATMAQSDLPKGRNGKHKGIVTKILADLAELAAGTAIKVPLSDLAESKEKVRSALNRASRKAERKVLTSSDEKYLYVWNG